MPQPCRVAAIGAVALITFGCAAKRPAVPAIYLDPRPLQWTWLGDTPLFVLAEQIKAEASKQNVDFARIDDVSVADGGCRVHFTDTAGRAYRALVRLDGTVVMFKQVIDLQ
jgi:hypothetical protein